MAEAQSLFLGLILSKKGDSQVIILACIKKNSSSWQLKYVLQKIWNIIDYFHEVILSHTYREGNRVSDYLSNLGCNGITNFTLQPSASIEHYKDLQKLISNEIVDYQQKLVIYHICISGEFSVFVEPQYYY